MAIRLRLVSGWWVALCAVESDAKEGDIYLDDSQHFALTTKFFEDYQGRTIDFRYSDELVRLMDSQKVRDAREEIVRI